MCDANLLVCFVVVVFVFVCYLYSMWFYVHNGAQAMSNSKLHANYVRSVKERARAPERQRERES